MCCYKLNVIIKSFTRTVDFYCLLMARQAWQLSLMRQKALHHARNGDDAQFRYFVAIESQATGAIGSRLSCNRTEFLLAVTGQLRSSASLTAALTFPLEPDWPSAKVVPVMIIRFRRIKAFNDSQREMSFLDIDSHDFWSVSNITTSQTLASDGWIAA